MSVNYCELSKHLYEALGHVLDSMDCNLAENPDNEGILLPYGDHVISVKLDHKPLMVFVSLTDGEGPVCGGDISTSGVTLMDDGFVLYVHVKTNETLVRWIVKN
jgi:hypothetical protein